MSRLRTDEAQGATFVELFFDLVFVYAITQLTATVLHDLTWEVVGRNLLVFWLVWWAWTQFTWTLNLADTEHTQIRLLTLVATAVAFFLAQAVPDAYDTAGLWFAISYTLVRLLGLWGQVWVIGDDEVQSAGLTRFASASSVGIILVVIGGFVDPELRAWFWLGAILADFATVTIAGRRTWVLEAGHFAERHGLIVIIALGESLIAAGNAAGELVRDASFAFTTIGAVVATCALWWTYFGSLHPRFERRLDEQNDETRAGFARDVFSLWHAVVVAGVIGVAVAFEEAVAHPGDALSSGGALALTIGTAMFLGGMGAAAWRADLPRPALGRVALAVAALVLTPLVTSVSGGVALWALSGLVAVMILIDSRTPESMALA